MAADIAQQASFTGMVLRRNRRGMRTLRRDDGAQFWDRQVFWWKTLEGLLRQTGFHPQKCMYSGFIPPLPAGPDLSRLEIPLSRIPLLRSCGYFYRMGGVRP